MVQAARHRLLHNAVTGWELVPMIAGRNRAPVGFREARTLWGVRPVAPVVEFALSNTRPQIAFA